MGGGGGGVLWVRAEYLSHCPHLQHSALMASIPSAEGLKCTKGSGELWDRFSCTGTVAAL